MTDNPRSSDTPQPPRPPDLSLKPSPEFQEKLDKFREQKEAKQDAGLAVDHRQAKAENQAARATRDEKTAGGENTNRRG
jgi:hypothetical protein